MSELFRGDMGRRPGEPVSTNDIDLYMAGHQHQKGWDDAMRARNFGMENVLPYFENECAKLSGRANGELRNVRELTAFLDRNPRSAARLSKTKEELVLDLEKLRDHDRYVLNRQNPAFEAQEDEVAEGNTEAWNEDIAEFCRGNVENVLHRLEEKTARVNELIEVDSLRLLQKDLNEREREEILQRIDRRTNKRDALRQIRANLLREYFKHDSMH